MAYTAPTFDASGQTWAQLGTRGFSGHAKALAAAMSTQTPTAAANEQLGMLLESGKADKVIERARNIVDNYLNMDAATKTANKTATKNAIFDLQVSIGTLNAALGEIGVLVEAN